MKTISQDVIKAIANYINETSNKDHRIPTKGNPQNPETPQYFEIVDFDEIDNSERRLISTP